MGLCDGDLVGAAENVKFAMYMPWLEDVANTRCPVESMATEVQPPTAEASESYQSLPESTLR